MDTKTVHIFLRDRPLVERLAREALEQRRSQKAITELALEHYFAALDKEREPAT